MKNLEHAKFSLPLLTAMALVLSGRGSMAQTTAFTYQGQLVANGSPASGNFDLRFSLYNASTGGNQVGNALTNSGVSVVNGLFTTTLDFGPGIFNGTNLWLEIGVRTNGGSGFMTLSPLQALTPTPYAITASNLSGTLPAAQLTGLLPASVLSGSFAGPLVLSNASNSFTGGFTGNGGGLTNLGAANLVGTIPDNRLSANVALLNVPNGATQATGVPVITNGFIISANVTSGGSGYVVAPTVTVTDSTGSNAVIEAAVFGGAVTSLTVQDAGNHYSSAASLTIAPPPSNASQTFVSINYFTGVNTMTNPNNIFAGAFTGNGAGLTNLNAASLTGPLTNTLLPITLTVGGTNVIAPLTVPPRVPTSALGSIVTGEYPVSVSVVGGYVYVVNLKGNSLQVFDASSPSQPALIGSIATGQSPTSVAVAGRYAYVMMDGGGNPALQIFDVSNPSAPVSIGSVSGFTGFLLAVAGRYVYAGGGGDGFQVIDVDNPFAPVIVGSVATGGQPESGAVAGRYIYVVNAYTNSLQIFDASNPFNPVLVGSAAISGSPGSVVVVGQYAYVANFDGNTLQIFDVSTPSAPVSVGSAGTGASPHSVVVAGRYAYVENSTTLQIFDVSTPSAPASLGSVNTGSAETSGGVAVVGRYAYVVNGGGDSLQIFDLGGAYIQQLESGAIETGTLQTRDTVTVGNNLDVRGGLTASGSARISGGLSVDNGNISGNGSGLTNLNAANLSGTVPGPLIPTNVALLNASQTFAGATALTNAANTFVGTFSGNGAGLANVTASGLSLPTNNAPSNPTTIQGWINVTNGTQVFKVPLYQ